MTNLNSIKLVVLGSKKAGKSALTVRYLTKRFIGEYRSNIDLVYKQTITVDSVSSDIEVLDISRWTTEENFPLEQVHWADACVVVYNICDGESFLEAHAILARIHQLRSDASLYVPVVLLGNKRDLEHARMVGLEAGRKLASQYGSQFYEVSAADSYLGVSIAFQNLLRETRSVKLQRSLVPRQRKLSMFAVSKMIGAIIGHAKNSPKSNLINNNNNNNSVNNNNHNNSKKKRPSLSL